LPLLCDHHFGKAFQIKKPPRTWIFKASLKWGSCYFGYRPKLSVLHLIFILCWSVICLPFSITGFVIELVQWVSALVSHLLRGSVEGECCWEQCCLWTASVVVQWVSALVSHLLRGSVEGECCWEQCCLRTASVVVRWVSALVTH